jgi:hypothetical protein
VIEVWLWDACVPLRSGHGISNDEGRARQAAEDCLRGCRGSAARVDRARGVLGDRLTDDYQRTGPSWSARRRRNGQVTWRLLPAGGALAA